MKSIDNLIGSVVMWIFVAILAVLALVFYVSFPVVATVIGIIAILLFVLGWVCRYLSQPADAKEVMRLNNAYLETKAESQKLS